MREVFAEHRPTVVFHAAAYKHVAMMENNPVEAVRNNALATRLVARIAGELGVGAFVLVSTDKAVKPATVMGASKALAEWAVEAAAARYPGTRFATVRFGNVLGSSGSVVPIFRRQIAAGGPVTVTDERMTRYFMTIPEAVQLDHPRRARCRGAAARCSCSRWASRCEILDLARDDDRALGLEPDRDIAIEIVGAPAGREAPRGAVQPLRAAAADAGPEDRPAPERDAARPGLGRADLRRDQPARPRGRRRRPRRPRRASCPAHAEPAPIARPGRPVPT